MRDCNLNKGSLQIGNIFQMSRKSLCEQILIIPFLWRNGKETVISHVPESHVPEAEEEGIRNGYECDLRTCRSIVTHFSLRKNWSVCMALWWSYTYQSDSLNLTI